MWNTYWKKCSRILMVIASSLYFYSLKIPIMAYNYFYSWKKNYICICMKRGFLLWGHRLGLRGPRWETWPEFFLWATLDSLLSLPGLCGLCETRCWTSSSL